MPPALRAPRSVRSPRADVVWLCLFIDGQETRHPMQRQGADWVLELPGERGMFRLAPDRFAASNVPWDAFSEAEVEAGQNLERTRALLQIGS